MYGYQEIEEVEVEVKVEVKVNFNKETMLYKSFTEMPVWQKAHGLAIEVFNITIDLPRSEDYGLTSQIRKSSNGVAACIAEGFGRSSKKDKSYFYVIARGSSYETQNHLLYGNRVGYFESKKTHYLFVEYNQLIFELNKLIKSLES
jgi:four helix bundle protein